MEGLRHLLLLLLCCSFASTSHCFSWPFSSPPPPPPPPTIAAAAPTAAAEFALVGGDSIKGSELVEKARAKLAAAGSSCWHAAYRGLFASCSEIVADKEKQSRLAWQLTGCFQSDSGRPPLPACAARSPMVSCLKKLDEVVHNIYLQFFLETGTICHQLQAGAFKQDTERLVNELARSSRSASERLAAIEERSTELLQSSEKALESLSSIGEQTQKLSESSRHAESRIENVMERTEAILEQSKGIADQQLEIKEGQSEMKGAMDSGMAFLRESYASLGDGLEGLRKEAAAIEREVSEVGASMSSRMQGLQSTADDIGSAAGASLEKQRLLLDGQAAALDGLDFLAKFQSQALQESREAAQELAEFGRRQQAELMRKQEAIEAAHERLMRNSQAILDAQEAFESKQASIFAALDRLHALHAALLSESRFIKSFFFYACVVFLLYMLTSTKQTFGIRARLYIGLCVTFVLELAVIRLRSGSVDADPRRQQERITSDLFVARSSFLAVAAVQILYSICTYRDYEVLNHRLLKTLMEKVEVMGRNPSSSSSSERSDGQEDDDGWRRYSWIEEDLPEEVGSRTDPDYLLLEEAGESCTSASLATGGGRAYHLRPRRARRML